MRRPPISIFCGCAPSPAPAAAAGTKLAWKAATTASTSASGTSASATIATKAPTGISSPSCASWRRRTPPTFTSRPPEILSVSTSQISSPGETRSPTWRCHAVSRPFSIERPHFGTVIEWIAGMVSPGAGGQGARDLPPPPPSVVVGHALDGGADLRRARDVEILERVGERHGNVRGGHSLDRRLQRPEGLLRHQRGDVGRQRAARIRLVHDHDPSSLLGRLEYSRFVHRRRGPPVDDLAVDLPLRYFPGRLLGEVDHAPVGDDRDAFSFAHHVGLSERDRVAL